MPPRHLAPSLLNRLSSRLARTHHITSRTLSSSTTAPPPPRWTPGPSPPKLAPAEQAEFERLQRAAASAGVFSAPKPSASTASSTSSTASTGTAQADDQMHADARRGAPPEFEGERNPRTGEVGGPKNEPLRWGAGGDWSFNGRVTDF
ncbi:MAG: putative mitochondrial protein, conserved [Trizodia sp. TS-e1964]|nr:MAG: putative mitochondrial protein, conserved [Trizodia sp. TS-e1964]